MEQLQAQVTAMAQQMELLQQQLKQWEQEQLMQSRIDAQKKQQAMYNRQITEGTYSTRAQIAGGGPPEQPVRTKKWNSVLKIVNFCAII